MYHTNQHIKEETVRAAFVEGYYENDRETHWILENGKRIGIILIHDISDTIPLFDIRLDENCRGKGYGVRALRWLQEYLFEVRGKIRIEAYTRVDNIGMRRCFSKAGFVKEGYLRNAWENEDGTVTDSIVYCAIKEDWILGNLTLISIDDVPF
ncbi:GNAT family N-acetyltransferase [Lysinibacillus sphaericus]|uniref:GNAT family N-acetyltransferase n=1 Tax=Lysinibacillus sphaericus TaxID=1421 RepID=UPI002DBC38E7|nr:GNAT family protein [Lysinibacillus sphaericus]MEB7454815.1 GNAT family N-acetyltransferase [Lysinibacillus sphaericus]